ncbi:MAG TPA: LytR C-terminal domain-containing protein [Kineosporiaceae bacterium]
MSNSTRSSAPSTSGYDERYVVPLEASRRGAHRARVSPVMAVLPVIAVVGLVVGAVALVYVFFGKLGTGSDPAAQVTPAPAARTSGSPSPSAATSTAPSSPASPTAAAGTVDTTVPVAVYNGSGTTGLGRKVADKLSAAGWTLGTVGTWTGAPVAETTVYFGAEQQRATVQAIVKSLGHGVPKLSAAKAGAGITVVIGPDLRGTGASTSASSSKTRTTTKAASSSSTTATKSTTPAASKTPTETPTAGSPSPTAAN